MIFIYLLATWGAGVFVVGLDNRQLVLIQTKKSAYLQDAKKQSDLLVRELSFYFTCLTK